MKTHIEIGLIVYFCIFSLGLFAQSSGLKGIVLDNKNNKPLPFVHIVYNAKMQGITTDIDGKFYFNDISKIDFLKFIYIGYQTKVIAKEIFINQSEIRITLSEEIYKLNEVVVLPGENPAHRIINKVLENSRLNDPEELESYYCKSYDKMYFTTEFEKSLKNTENGEISGDSVENEILKSKFLKLMDSQYLMMIESVSERYYKRPGMVNEKVIASKVSGLKEPSVVLLATQLQSFSFYNEMITLLESRYVSPISKGCTNRYFFQIEDTSYTAAGDTVFSISYRPKRGRNFDGLKGILNINTYKYAIQSVIAEPVEYNGFINLKINQNYQLTDDHWFPVELNTELVYSDIARIKVGDQYFKPVGIGKTYLSDIKINPDIGKIKFDAIELKVADKAYKQSDSVWEVFRHDSLNDKELKTYHILDSLGKAKNLDMKMKSLTSLMSGYLPFYFIDIQVLDVFDYNAFEGSRPGFGFRTNNKISSFFSIGAYAAYGFMDEKWKYGTNLNFLINRNSEIQCGFAYKKDVIESSGYKFFEEKPASNSSELYRDYMLSDMTYDEEYEANVTFRLLKKVKINLHVNQLFLRNNSAYTFFNDGVYDLAIQQYRIRQAGIGIKYSPNENLADMAGGLYSLNSFPSPIFYFNLVRGIKDEFSDFDFFKIESKINLNFMTKSFGLTCLQLVGGKVLGDLPYFMLYNGHGNYNDFGVETANSFATMRMNEFLSDEFISLHYRQDFGNLIIKREKFRPKFILVNSVGFGKISKPELHQNIDFKSMDKGYFETGLLINDIILIKKIFGFGFGIYYRYGPYSFSNISNNFAFKFSATFEL